MRLLLFTLVIALVTSSVALAQGIVIPRNIEDVAVIIEKWDDSGVIQTHGTGFFYQDSATLTTYLVSNRHVFAGHDSLHVRYNADEGRPTGAKILLLNRDTKAPNWRAHPDANVDLAILPTQGTLKVRVLDSPRAKSSSEVSLGDIAYFIGFPIVASGNKVYPLLRHGVVAYIFREETRLRSGVYPEGTILIDGTSLGGNSGGPVISLPRQESNRASLIGVIQGHIIVGEENADLGIVIPAERLIEVINQ